MVEVAAVVEFCTTATNMLLAKVIAAIDKGNVRTVQVIPSVEEAAEVELA